MKYVLAVLIGIGVMVTLWDYGKWRHAELDKFGHGWSADQQLQPAGKLEGPYGNAIVGFRVRYPEGWDTQENSKVKSQKSKLTEERTEIVEWKQQFGMATIKIEAEKTEMNLVDLVNKEATGENKDRIYINSNGISVTVLTWDGDEMVRQKAFAIRSGKLMVIEVMCKKIAWNTYAKTFEEVYKSLVLF